MDPVMPPEALGAPRDKAADAARLLGSGNRLLLPCRLVQAGKVGVGAPAEAIGLSQPALSQHLARLREGGLVAARRNAQAVPYRLADPRIAAVTILLRDPFCAPPGDMMQPGTNPC